jgi:hypothetical protein
MNWFTWNGTNNAHCSINLDLCYVIFWLANGTAKVGDISNDDSEFWTLNQADAARLHALIAKNSAQ